MSSFARTYEVKESDVDANGHVHYSTYIDAAADVRLAVLADQGFSPMALRDLGIAPIYTTIHARFLREVRAGETLTITYRLDGLSSSGTRWKVHHDILKPTGKKACVLDIEGVVLDLRTRMPAIPPPGLKAAFDQIPRSSRFEEMPDGFRPT
jgi:acyl-CoA thioester hydrolase